MLANKLNECYEMHRRICLHVHISFLFTVNFSQSSPAPPPPNPPQPGLSNTTHVELDAEITENELRNAVFYQKK